MAQPPRALRNRLGIGPGDVPGGIDALQRRTLAGLITLGLGVRLASSLLVSVMAPDGVRFLSIARRFAAGDFQGALANDYHPLYPLLVALFRPFTGGFESSAFAVSILFSTLTIPLVFFIVRALFGRRPAFVAAAVFALLPPFVRPGADTLSEGVFLFFIALALHLGLRGYRRASRGEPIGAGLCAAAAYLTRPEGLGVLLAFGVFTAVGMVAGLEGRRRIGVAATGLLVLLGFLLPGAPYLAKIRAETGNWDLSMKKSTAYLTRTLDEKLEERNEEKPPDVEVVGTGEAALEVLEGFAGNLYYVPALLALLGLCLPAAGVNRRPWRLEVLFLCGAAIWFALCLFLLVSHGYLSHRHTLAGAFFLLPYAGRGAARFAESVAKPLERSEPFRRNFPGPAGPRALLLLLVTIAFLIGLVETLRPYRWDKAYVRDMGRTLSSWSDTGGAAIGDVSRVSYYAGLRHVPLPFNAGTADILALSREHGARLLVVDRDHLAEWSPPLFEALTRPGAPPEGFQPAGVWKFDLRRPKTLLVYRLEPPAHGR